MIELRRAGWVLAVLVVILAPGAMAQDAPAVPVEPVTLDDGVPQGGYNQKGRYLEPGGKRWRLTFNVGDRSPIEGSVQETVRPFDEFREEGTPQAPESFSFDEFGLAESESTYGLSLEYQWKWMTLFIDGAWLEAEATGIAPRDLFIGVKSIRFEGREYEYQAVPEGTPYIGTLDLFAFNFRAAFTPVTVNAGGTAEFVPWIFVGLFTLGGSFDTDAGPATEVIQYEAPPRDYVVGGRAEGDAAAAAPEIGIGGELKFRTGERSRLTFQANYSIFEFAGSTGDLGISARNEKDIDVDYSAYNFKAYFELPLSDKVNLLIGGEIRNTEVDGSVRAKDRDPEEVIELREKFNKDVAFKLETVVFNLGLRW